MRVIITGAAGEIGSQIVEELAGAHEIHLIDRVPVPEQSSIVADLTKTHSRARWKPWRRIKWPRWMDAFRGADVVVHLAVDHRSGVSQHQLLVNNIEATVNVIEAAARCRVYRVVYASSNWAVKALERELAPSCYMPDGPKITSETPPRPSTPYGVSKAFGEVCGRATVDQGRLGSFVAVRIGSNLPVCPDDDRRHRWIGIEDIRGLFRRCVEAKFEGFHVVYGVSAQPTVPYDLLHTRRLLSWKPRQRP